MIQKIFAVSVETVNGNYTNVVFDSKRHRMSLVSKENKESFEGFLLKFDSFERYEDGKVILKLMESDKEEKYIKFTAEETRLENLIDRLSNIGVDLKEFKSLLQDFDEEPAIVPASSPPNVISFASLEQPQKSEDVSPLLSALGHSPTFEIKTQQLLTLLCREGKAGSFFSGSNASTQESKSAVVEHFSETLSQKAENVLSAEFPETFEMPDVVEEETEQPPRTKICGVLNFIKCFVRRRIFRTPQHRSVIGRLEAFFRNISTMLSPDSSLDLSRVKALAEYKPALRVVFVFHTRKAPFSFQNEGASWGQSFDNTLKSCAETRKYSVRDSNNSTPFGEETQSLKSISKHLAEITKIAFKPEEIVTASKPVSSQLLGLKLWKTSTESFAEIFFEKIKPLCDLRQDSLKLFQAFALIEQHFVLVCETICKSAQISLLEKSRLRLGPLMIFQLRFFDSSIREVNILYNIFLDFVKRLRLERKEISLFSLESASSVSSKKTKAEKKSASCSAGNPRFFRMNQLQKEISSLLSFLEGEV